MPFYLFVGDELQTKNEIYLKLNEWNVAPTDFHFYAYPSPELAVLFAPAYKEDFKETGLVEIEVDGDCVPDQRIRFNFDKIKPIKKITMPKLELSERVAFAILCAKKICHDKEWGGWANSWISGEDRGSLSASKADKLIWKSYRTRYEEKRVLGHKLPNINPTRAASDASKTADFFASGSPTNVLHFSAKAASTVAFAFAKNCIDFCELANQAMGVK